MSNAERRINPGESISTIFYDERGKARVRTEARIALAAFEAQLNETEPISLPDFLRRANEAKISPTALARQVGVSKKTMFRVYDLLGIQRLSPGEYISAKWEDPEYANAVAKANREHMTRRWEDPPYRQYMEGVNVDLKSIVARKDSARKEMNRRWADPQWRDKMDEVAQRRWTDEAREQRSEEMKAQWENPEYKDYLLELRQSEDYRLRLVLHPPDIQTSFCQFC